MEKDRTCVILGGGGHARVLLDSLIESDAATPYAILDHDRSLWGTDLLGIPILGDDDMLPEIISRGANCFAVGIGSIGNYHPRQRLFDLGISHKLEPLIIKHPKAICSRFAKVGPGSQMFPGCIINAGAEIGSNVIINSGAIIEHDCLLEDHVHVATGARLASAVHIGIGAHVGIGATIRQCITIGEGAVVGAGAVVVKDVSPYSVVTGAPARTAERIR